MSTGYEPTAEDRAWVLASYRHRRATGSAPWSAMYWVRGLCAELFADYATDPGQAPARVAQLQGRRYRAAVEYMATVTGYEWGETDRPTFWRTGIRTTASGR